MPDVNDITATYLMGKLLSRDGEFCQGAPLVPLPYYTFTLSTAAQTGEGKTGNHAKEVAFQHDNKNKQARRDSPIAYSDKNGRFVYFATDKDDKNLAGTPVAVFEKRKALFFPSYLVTIAQGSYGKNWLTELSKRLGDEDLIKSSIASLKAKTVSLNEGKFLPVEKLVDNQLTRDYIDWHKRTFKTQGEINVVTVPQYYTIVLTFSSANFVGGRVSLADFTDKVILTGDDIMSTRNQPASLISEVAYTNHEGDKESTFIAATFWVETELLEVPLAPSELFCRFDIDLRTVGGGDSDDAKVKALAGKGIPLTYSLSEQVLHLPIQTIAGRSAWLNGDPISVEEALINHAPQQFSALLSAINQKPTPIKDKLSKEKSESDFLPTVWHNLQTHKSQYQAAANTLESGLNWDVISQTYSAAFGVIAGGALPSDNFKFVSQLMGISGSASSFLKMASSFTHEPKVLTAVANIASVLKLPSEQFPHTLARLQDKFKGKVMHVVPTQYHPFLGQSQTLLKRLGKTADTLLGTPLSAAELLFNINGAIKKSTVVETNNMALTDNSHKYAVNVQSISNQGLYTGKDDFNERSKTVELVKNELQNKLSEYKNKDKENVVLLEEKQGDVTAQLINVIFGFDKATIKLTDEGHGIIESVAKYLRLLLDPIAIKIIGHTCNTGKDEYNMGLSFDRAETFKQLLIEKIDPSDDLKLLWESRVEISGRGAAEPLFENDDEDGRKKNRRVEVVFFFNSAYQYPPCRSGIAVLEKQRRATVTANISADAAVIAAASSGVDVLLGLGSAFLGPVGISAYALWWSGNTLNTGVDAFNEFTNAEFEHYGKLKSYSEFSSATQYMMLANDGKTEYAAFLKKAYLKRALAINGLMRLIHRFHYEKGRHTSSGNLSMYDSGNALPAAQTDDERFLSYDFEGYINHYLLSDDWRLTDSFFPVYLDEVWLESVTSKKVKSLASLFSYIQGAVFVRNKVQQDDKSTKTLARGQHYKSAFPIHYLNSTDINFFKNLFVDKLPKFKDKELISNLVISVRPRGAKTLTDWFTLPAYLKKNSVLSPFDQIRILVIFNNDDKQFKELLDESKESGAPLMVPVSARPIRYNLVFDDIGPVTTEYVSLLKKAELCSHEEQFENRYGAIIQPTFKFGQSIIAGTRPMAEFGDSSLSGLFSKEESSNNASGHYEMDYFYEVFIPGTVVKVPVAYGSQKSWYGESDVKLFPVSLDPERKYSVPTKNDLGKIGTTEEQDDHVFYEKNFLSAQNTENRTAPQVFDSPKIVFSLYQKGKELIPQSPDNKDTKIIHFDWNEPTDLQALIYTKSLGTQDLINQNIEPDVFPIELFLHSNKLTTEPNKDNILKFSQRQSIRRIGYIGLDGTFEAVTINSSLTDDFSDIKGRFKESNKETGKSKALLQQEGTFPEAVSTDVFAIKLELDYINAVGDKVQGLKPVKDLDVFVDRIPGDLISLKLKISAENIGLTNADSQKLMMRKGTVNPKSLPESWYVHTEKEKKQTLLRMKTNESGKGDDVKINDHKQNQSKSGVYRHSPEKLDEWIEAGDREDTYSLSPERRVILKNWIDAKDGVDAKHALKDNDNSPSKKFLLEHEMAFDRHMLGFPSIQGCHAIVYQTERGIYGLHNFGGSKDDEFSTRADLFSTFVSNHESFGGKALRLYGVSFVGNNQRGYSGNPKSKWKEELLEFANKLNYKGKISGYDLYKSFSDENNSAYVEFNINEEKSDIYIRKWNVGESLGDKVANPSPNDHKIRTGSFDKMLISELGSVCTEISRVGLTKISKEKLRS